MKLTLTRVYKREGVNGILSLNEQFICFTIELPWRDNKRNVSCIPEGQYELRPRYSPKFKNHLELQEVPNRSFILFHPANSALKDLRGCIGPVKQLTGIGRGIYSKLAMEKLLSIVHQAIGRKEKVVLNINSNRYEYLRQVQEAHS